MCSQVQAVLYRLLKRISEKCDRCFIQTNSSTQLHILPLGTEMTSALASTGSVSTKAQNTQSYPDLIIKQNKTPKPQLQPSSPPASEGSFKAAPTLHICEPSLPLNIQLSKEPLDVIGKQRLHGKSLNINLDSTFPIKT